MMCSLWGTTFRVLAMACLLLSCSPSAERAEEAEQECECDRDCPDAEGVCDDGACLPVCNDDGDPCPGGGSECQCADPFRMPNLCADETARRTPLVIRIESTTTAAEATADVDVTFEPPDDTAELVGVLVLPGSQVDFGSLRFESSPVASLAKA